MAGFRQRVPAPADIAMIAHPAVTLIVDLSEAGGIVYGAHGLRRRGSFAAGLLPGQLRAGGWGGECLWSRFRSQIGVTPKRAAQLARFDHAAHLLAAGHAAAGVAAQSGYADQSHLHREVKAIAGVTPAAVAAAPWLAIDGTAWPAPPRR